MWENIKNLDLFIRVIDDNTNKYVCFPAQYHRDYMSFTLTFSFEDWSGMYVDKKQSHLEYTATYKNAKGEYLVKFQDEDFNALCVKVEAWNNAHRVDISERIFRQIVHEQETNHEAYVEPQRKDEDDVQTLFDGIVNWFKK